MNEMEQYLSNKFPVQIVRSEAGGRSLISRRAIKAGEIILAALPAAIVSNQPMLRCSYCFAGHKFGSPEGTSSLLRCSSCRRAHYCSKDCQRSDWIFHKRECKANGDEGALTQMPQADSITLQLLTRLVDGKLLVTPESRPSTFFYVHTAEDVEQMVADASGKLNNHFIGLIERGRLCGLIPNADSSQSSGLKSDDTTLLSALLSFDRNDFGILDELMSLRASAVCPAAALLQHSCCPNTVLGFSFAHELDAENKLKNSVVDVTTDVLESEFSSMEELSPDKRARRILVFRTNRDVEEGEELTHSYVDQVLLCEQRKEYLLRTYGFECSCAACVDASSSSSSSSSSLSLSAESSSTNVLPPRTCYERALLSSTGGSLARVGIIQAAVAESSRMEDEERVISTYAGLDDVAVEDIKVAHSMLDAVLCLNSSTTFENKYLHVLPDLEEREALRRIMLPGHISLTDAKDYLKETRLLESALYLFLKHLHPLHVQVMACLTALADRYMLMGDHRAMASVNEHLVAFYQHVYRALSALGSRSNTTRVCHPMLSLQMFTLGDVYLDLAQIGTREGVSGNISYGVSAAESLGKLFVEYSPENLQDEAGARIRPVQLPLLAITQRSGRSLNEDVISASRKWAERAKYLFSDIAISLRITHGPLHSLTRQAEERISQTDSVITMIRMLALKI
jgi:hypothetical protein